MKRNMIDTVITFEFSIGILWTNLRALLRILSLLLSKEEEGESSIWSKYHFRNIECNEKHIKAVSMGAVIHIC